MPRRPGPQELRTALKEEDLLSAHEFLLRESGLTIASSSLYNFAAKKRTNGHVVRNLIAGAGSTTDPNLRLLDVIDARTKYNHLMDMRQFPDYSDQDVALFGPFIPLTIHDPGPLYFAQIPISNPREQMVADMAYELRALAAHEDKRLPRDVKKIVLDIGEIAVSN